MKFIKKHLLQIEIIILLIFIWVLSCVVWELNHEINKLKKEEPIELKIELVPNNQQESTEEYQGENV